MCVLLSSHFSGLRLSQTLAVWPSSSSFPSIFVHNTIHYQPGISPRQAPPREAIVLSEKSIKAVRLPNKSIRHQEAFQNDIICHSGGNK